MLQSQRKELVEQEMIEKTLDFQNDKLEFVKNPGEIRKRIFYENVRDYQGEKNPVNTEIRNTISKDILQDKFILLNNGVTIITKSLKSLEGNNYELRDFQIVNGCQTSNEIYNQKEMAVGKVQFQKKFFCIVTIS